jgi:hypothetical protein
MTVLDEMLIEHVILPSQFYDDRNCRIEEAVPIRRLMHAILRDALECVAGRTGKTGFSARKTSQEALDWIEDTDDREIFSFTSVCDSLQIDPEAVRTSLHNWRASGRRLTRRSPVKCKREILPLPAPRQRNSIGNRSRI